MIKKILDDPNGSEDGVIIFTNEEVEKYGLYHGKTVSLKLVSKARAGKPAEILLTVLD